METAFGKQVNNDIYHELGERWYTAKDDPVALLRAESRARNPWVAREIRQAFPAGKVHVLDIGCGAGFLANALAQQGMEVTGLDVSAASLGVAQLHDTTGRVQYQQGDANRLPFADETFEVACAMDFLEHVERPAQIVAEAARILKPGGLFFFHTFNRNFASWLIGIKGVEWFVKNTPRNLHLYRLFIKPAELAQYCMQSGMQVPTLAGLAPVIASQAFWKMVLTGRVDDDFQFQFTRSTWLGYIGTATKGLRGATV